MRAQIYIKKNNGEAICGTLDDCIIGSEYFHFRFVNEQGLNSLRHSTIKEILIKPLSPQTRETDELAASSSAGTSSPG